VLRDNNATVLQFRDSALRRPIDVVAWMKMASPTAPERADLYDNVVPFTAFARAAGRDSRLPWSGGFPGGEAA